MKNILWTLLLLPTLSYSLVGLSVGDKAPALKLKDTQGNLIDLSKSKKSRVVVFYRGSWCPYCINQLKNIQTQVMPKIKSSAELIAISVDRLKVAKKMRDKNNFKFRVVSDSKADSLKAFHIINKISDELVSKYKNSYKIDVEADSGETHHMIAHPAVFIVKNGKIAFADVNTDYKKRTSNKKILESL